MLWDTFEVCTKNLESGLKEVRKNLKRFCKDVEKEHEYNDMRREYEQTNRLRETNPPDRRRSV